MWLYISNIYTRPRIIQARNINKALHFCIFYLNTDFSVYGVFSKAIWLSVWMLGSRIQKDLLEIWDGGRIGKVGNGSSRGGDGEVVMIEVGIMVVVAATIPAWQKCILIISLSDSSLFTSRIFFLNNHSLSHPESCCITMYFVIQFQQASWTIRP